MRPIKLTVLAAAGLAICFGAPERANAQASDPAIPVGTLSAYPSVVQAGTFPTLSWGITYPSEILTVVTITPPGTITPKKSLKMDVRVIGASVKSATTYAPTEALFSYNGSSYSRIWYNTQPNVNPNTIVKTQTVDANKNIRFGGRYYWQNSWSSMYTSTSTSGNVRALISGDTPPTTYPLYQQPTLESFLAPYLDEQGKIKVGPKDVIILFELTHTDTDDLGYDLQDLVLLCTFRDP